MGIGWNAWHAQAGCPSHGGDDVRIPASAFAHDADRQNPSVPGDPRNAYAVVGARSDDTGDARSMPRTVSRLAVFESRQIEIGFTDPIAWIRRIGIPSVTVVGADEARARFARDEIVARQQLA